MAIAIDGSSPAIVTGNPTATTGSFTPPNGALLVVAFSGNSFSSVNPPSPSISDSLGAHLSYTLSDWRSRVDHPPIDGQVAIWTAPVVTGQAMTVSVTNNDGSASSHCAVKVWVLTGANTGGVHGADSVQGASAIAQSYTGNADGGQGFMVVCDWDALGAETAGSGCTLDGTGTIPTTQISYGFCHRTIADDTNGGLTTLNMSLPGSSQHLTWAYIELVPLVGDPAEKDPPPFVVWHPPARFAPNWAWNPWQGTANAAPTDTGIRIHESTPGLVVNTDGTVVAATSAPFTPPAGSLLLILWAGNSSFGANPTAPSITDNLGAHLTYTLSDWQSRADTPTVDGQAAAWAAPVITSASMTITVSNNAANTFRHAAFQVLVITNAGTTGAHGKAGSNSANLITQSYTAQASLGQGFVAVSDFAATGTPVAGTDCWVAEDGTAGTIPVSQLSYGFFKRTIPDDVNTVANRLNVSMAATSNALSWVYVEILPPAGVAFPPAGVRRRPIPTYARRGRTAAVVPAQVVLTPPVFVPLPLTARIKPIARRRGAIANPLPVQATPAAPAFVAQPIRSRLRAALTRRNTTAQVPPAQTGVFQSLRSRLRLPQLTRGRQVQPPPQPGGVPQGWRPRVRLFRPAEPRTAMVVPPQVTAAPPAYPPQALRVRGRGLRLFRGRTAQPVPDQVTVTPPPYVPQALRARTRIVRLFRGLRATPVPAQITATPPALVPQALRSRGRLARLFRGRTATPVPTQAPAPVPVRPRTVRLILPRRARTSIVPRQEPAPLVTRVRQRFGQLLRGKFRAVVPAQVIVVPPAYPPQPAKTRRRFWFPRRRQAAGPLGHECATHRPSTGTTVRPSTGMTAYSTAMTTRPSTGTTSRPNTGTTKDPC